MPHPQPNPKQAPSQQSSPRKETGKKETPFTFRDWASI
jgi:hypothetical protein